MSLTKKKKLELVNGSIVLKKKKNGHNDLFSESQLLSGPFTRSLATQPALSIWGAT